MEHFSTPQRIHSLSSLLYVFGEMTEFARAREPIAYLIRPLHAFAKHKLAGALLLLFSAIAAIIWANSPWAHAYESALEIEAVVGIGSFAVSKTIHHWINDGLMGIFFFVIGLEIKREVLSGELSTIRKAALPITAAVGGMLVPALIYLAMNSSGVGEKGWGIPMATDIAFALGVLALLGDRVPTSLKVFLTALAIVDDIGAVLVIALFYTDTIQMVSLAIAAMLLVVSVAANLSGVRYSVFYFILGTLVWLAFLESGVHATLAAVLMALTIPVRTRLEGAPFVERSRGFLSALDQVGLPSGQKLLSPDQMRILSSMETALEEATPPLQGLERALVPLVTFAVLPVFALANAGVSISGGVFSAYGDSVSLGIVLGLFIGKQAGILGFSWLSVKLGIADLPSDVTWTQVHGVAVLGGIGFTMSLFIGGLAFSDPQVVETVKVGILTGSGLSAVVGWLLLRSLAGPKGVEASPTAD
jgi:NhaA family Na+:H+ antiporter